MTGKIGRYRLLDVSGTGTFATVHRAEDERLGDVVAIKVLAENHSLDPEVRERFLREGRALRRIASAHVIAVHDLGETERQQPYLVMQHADRGTLAQRVEERRAAGWVPTSSDVHTVAAVLSEAIAATHRAHIVHRDLSPNNVLLRSLPSEEGPSDLARPASPSLIGEDEQLVLADLGLCKDLARHSGLTAAGGTDGFRPPEQRTGTSFVAPAADLWSLSALITWLITAEAPTEGEDVTDRVVAAGLPAALGAALNAGLAADPDVRPTDAEQWFAAVDTALRPPAEVDPGVDDGDANGGSDGDVGAGSDIEAEGDTAHRPGTLARLGAERNGWLATSTGRRVAAGAALAIIVLVAMIVLVLPLGDGVQRADLADGQVLVERTVGEVTLGVAGPSEVVAGERAVFLARDEGFVVTVWVAPDGVTLVDQPTLSFATGSPGVASVELLGVTLDGEVVRVQHDVRVREADDP